ncbi:hypothetical protein PInf_008049 [Phytophthora infestans]|nr:hypothetical protein PInf_008049 [Phytophthora infestans]
MLDVARALRESPAVTLGVDGATNVLSRSLSNVIAHDPRPWFVEYLRADLKKESEPEVTKKRQYTMVLYSASRWSSVNYMFQRLPKVKRPMTAVVTAVMNEKVERNIDPSYQLPSEFTSIVMDPQFWGNVSWHVKVFDPICKCIGVMESNSATMFTAYACFVYVFIHARETSPGDALLTKLIHRWNRIQSPVHALAFYCDSFYHPFRLAVAKLYGQDPIELGKGNICAQCRFAIELVCREDQDQKRRALDDFLRFCTTEAEIASEWSSITQFPPQKIWTQGRSKFPVLAELLVKVYTSPASTAGVERQHKVGKRIHSSARNRLGAGLVEEQDAVAHNAAVATMEAPLQRQRFEQHMVSDFVMKAGLQSGGGDARIDSGEAREPADEVETAGAEEGIAEVLTEAELMEQEILEAALSLVSTPLDIDDNILFPNVDDD